MIVLGVRLVNRGVIWFKLILGMDLIILHFFGLNSLFAEGTLRQGAGGLDDAGCDASEGRR